MDKTNTVEVITGKKFIEGYYNRYRLQLTTIGEHTPILCIFMVSTQDGVENFKKVFEFDMSNIYLQACKFYEYLQENGEGEFRCSRK